MPEEIEKKTIVFARNNEPFQPNEQPYTQRKGTITGSAGVSPATIDEGSMPEEIEKKTIVFAPNKEPFQPNG